MPAVDAKVASCARYMTLLYNVIGADFCRYFSMEIDRPRLPNVERWFAILQRRPAYQEYVMLPFDDLYGRLSF